MRIEPEKPTSELDALELAYLLAAAEGLTIEPPHDARPREVWVSYGPFDHEPVRWDPAQDWADGGPLITKHRIATTQSYSVVTNTYGRWLAKRSYPYTVGWNPWRYSGAPRQSFAGETPLLAAMRAIVGITRLEFKPTTKD